MAVIIAAPSGGLRSGLSGATAASMADNLPAIDFGFDNLRVRMADFTRRFDRFVAEGRKVILHERNQHYEDVGKLEDDQRRMRQNITTLEAQLGTHAQRVADEAAEQTSHEAALSSITAQHDERSGARDRLRTRIATTTTEIAQRQEAQARYAAQLDAQARWNSPELDFWVDYLCMRIEGAGQVDRIKFVYSHLDERDWGREAWFELCTENRDYEVAECRPKLEREAVDRALERLNENRDLGVFLKEMRRLFVEASR